MDRAVVGLCPTENVRRTLDLRVRGIRLGIRDRFRADALRHFPRQVLILSFFLSFENVGTGKSDGEKKLKKKIRFLEIE